MKRDIYLDNMPLAEALGTYLSHLETKGALSPGAPETVPVDDALDRVTAGPVFARTSSPHYHAAAMDGIAVKAADTFGASESEPKTMILGAGTYMVDTGEPLPEGTDSVIMIEDVHFTDEMTFELAASASPWQHVRVIGEDIVAAEMLLSVNHRVRPVDMGAL